MSTAKYVWKIKMKRINIKYAFLFLIASLVSCSKPSENQILLDSNFPLEQTRRVHFDETIKRVAVSDDWIGLQTANKLIALSTQKGELAWTVDFKSTYSARSEFQIVNNTLVAASDRQVIIIDETGHTKDIELSPDEESVWEIVAIYPDYVYVLRGPDWILEAYELSTNTLQWRTKVGRGGVNVFYDSEHNIAYVTTRDYAIRAIDNSSGTVLWKEDKSVISSTFADGVLFVGELTNEDDMFAFSALDVETRREFWRITIDSQAEIYKMAILNNLLVIGARSGLIAINAQNGEKQWGTAPDETFFTSPVEVKGIIYAKGSSHTIYAISPENGRIIGSLTLEGDDDVEPTYESAGEVHVFRNGIIFNTENNLLEYQAP